MVSDLHSVDAIVSREVIPRHVGVIQCAMTFDGISDGRDSIAICHGFLQTY